MKALRGKSGAGWDDSLGLVTGSEEFWKQLSKVRDTFFFTTSANCYSQDQSISGCMVNQTFHSLWWNGLSCQWYYCNRVNVIQGWTGTAEFDLSHQPQLVEHNRDDKDTKSDGGGAKDSNVKELLEGKESAVEGKENAVEIVQVHCYWCNTVIFSTFA